MDRQYRKRGAAGPRPGGPSNTKEAITLIGLNPYASAALCLLQTTTRSPRCGFEVHDVTRGARCDLRSAMGTGGHKRHTGEVSKRYPNAIPANAKECDHERR